VPPRTPSRVQDHPPGRAAGEGRLAAPELVGGERWGNPRPASARSWCDSELLSDGIADLVACGAVSNRFKRTNPSNTVFNVAMGSQRMYDLMHDNPTMEWWPADYVNDPRVIGQNDNVVSVNAMIEVDLTGQVNAKYLLHHEFSAAGGQLDFVRGAGYSQGGKSIIASPSTAAHGTVSRIVPRLQRSGNRSAYGDPVHRHGTRRVRSARKVSDVRALGLIGIAHPAFREQLLANARRLNIIGSGTWKCREQSLI
jgi:itaconate CoA-transferase